MQPPLNPTPMMRIGLKKSAILSLVAFTTAATLFTGCKKPEEKANRNGRLRRQGRRGEHCRRPVSSDRPPPPSRPIHASLVVDLAAAARLAHQVGNSGTFVLTGKASNNAPPSTVTVRYSAINPLDGHITITPTGSAFMSGSLVRPADDYARKVLTSSMKETLATPSQKANTNMALGLVEVREADAILHDIDAQQNHLERLLEARGTFMATQLQANDVMIAGLSSKDPTKSLAEVDKTAASAKTGENGVWFPSDSAPILAQAAIEKSIGELKTKGDALDAHYADLEKQRNDALAQAEKLSAQSELAKGKQSLDLFVQSSNQHKTAGDLSIQMEDTKSKDSAERVGVEGRGAQLVQLKTAITKFDDEHKQLNTGWEGVKKQIADVVANSKMIVTGEARRPPRCREHAAETTGPAVVAIPIEAPLASLNEAAEKIADVSANLDKLRKDVKDHLTKGPTAISPPPLGVE